MDIIKEFFDYQLLTNKSFNTSKSYSSDIKQFINYISEQEKDIKNITPIQIKSFLAYLSMKNISKKSITRKLSSIKSFFDFLIRKGDIDINPTINILSPKVGKSLPSVLTLSEFNRLVDSIQGKNFATKRDRAMIEMLYASGIRSEELLSLTDKDIHLRDREAKVLGKGGIERIVFFNEQTLEALLDYIPFKRSKFPNAQFLFLNRFGRRLSTRFLRNIVTSYSEKAGIEKEVSPHTFRHSFATSLLDKGVGLRSIQEMLGHKSISSTQIYTHISKSELRKCYLKYGPFE